MDRLLERISALLTSSVKTARGIKQIYIGDVRTIPSNSMPCIVINPIQTFVEIADNRRDFDTYTVEIVLILDARRYFNKNSVKYSAQQEAMDIYEERNSDGTIKTNTILGVIRQQLDSDSDYVLKSSDETVDYQRTGDREFPTIEPSLTIQCQSKIYNKNY